MLRDKSFTIKSQALRSSPPFPNQPVPTPFSSLRKVFFNNPSCKSRRFSFKLSALLPFHQSTTRTDSRESSRCWTSEMESDVCVNIYAAMQETQEFSSHTTNPLHLSYLECAPPHTPSNKATASSQSFPSLPITNESISVSAVSPALSPSNGL